MNEKRKIEQDLDADSAETRFRSDVAPKQTAQSGAPARHISGMRPAVHTPAITTLPSVPPAPLTPEDLLEDGWDDEQDDDSGPTLLDTHGSVPRELVAQARAFSDPLGGEREPETNEIRTREVATREIPTRMFNKEEAPTNRLPMPAPAELFDAGADAEDAEDDDDEFNHDDFPTRQTPMGLQAALLAYPLPSDSHRGLHETLVPAEESVPDLPSSAALAAPPVVAFPSPVAPQAAVSPDETAQMPHAPALPRVDELSQPPPPAERSSISKISQISQVSYPSSHPSQVSQVTHPSQGVRPLLYPTPTSITGAPLPLANTVRFAFLRNLSPNNDPPLNRLALVALASFGATLLLSAFIGWIIVLARH